MPGYAKMLSTTTALLKTNAEARQLWFLYHDNECSLAELKPRAVPARRRATRSAWSPLTAAAAGLALGLFSASMVWGYVGKWATPTTTLLAESFEAGASPSVMSSRACASRSRGA